MPSKLLSMKLEINEEKLVEIVKRNINLSVPELNKNWEEAIPTMIENEKQINIVVADLLYDRNFCRKTGIDYVNINSSDKNNVILAISQYLLQTCQRKK